MIYPEHLGSHKGNFKVIWDSGASLSITPDSRDFVGPITQPQMSSVLSGIVKGTQITGEGLIMWEVKDVNGNPRVIKTKGYLVPKVKMRLLSTNALTQAYEDETLTGNSQGLKLSGSPTDQLKPSLILGQTYQQAS